MAAEPLRERTTGSLVVTTYAPALRRDGAIHLERKTLDGLRRLARETGMAITLVAREWMPSLPMPLDPVSSLDQAPGIRIFLRRLARRPDRAAKAAIAEALQGASVVYGMGVDVLEEAVRRKVPIVPIIENLLANALRIERQQSRTWWESFRRQVSSFLEFQRLQACLTQAASVHAIGYVAYEALVDRYPAELFLDSRVRGTNVVDAEFVAGRCATLRGTRALRCVMFGRLEPIKGSDRIVDAALLAIRGGADVTLDVFGDGSLREQLAAKFVASGCQERIRLHGVVPFPELLLRVRECDLFLAGNTQDDPSCAYLEAFGSGLPILGFANRHWQRLAGASAAGVVVERPTAEAMGKAIAAMVDSPSTLTRMAQAARNFAVRHSFEEEFARRASSLRAVVEAVAMGRQR
ncbi:MAG: hypothetical protein RL398_3590 [Planctomycetota bacterium]|jgi:glycosyltransferase involved in cell wall biosynthesis